MGKRKKAGIVFSTFFSVCTPLSIDSPTPGDTDRSKSRGSQRRQKEKGSN